MAQGSEFPLKKPPGFHYDFFLLGITTLIAGLLGLPAPNGLIPQAPIHTASLVVWGHPMNNKRDEENDVEEKSRKGDDSRDSQEVPVSVVEQRVSNLAQGALCLVLLTGPFLHILSLIPRGVLAGLLYVDRFRSGRIQLTPVQLVHGPRCPQIQRNYYKDLPSHPRPQYGSIERSFPDGQMQSM